MLQTLMLTVPTFQSGDQLCIRYRSSRRQIVNGRKRKSKSCNKCELHRSCWLRYYNVHNSVAFHCFRSNRHPYYYPPGVCIDRAGLRPSAVAKGAAVAMFLNVINCETLSKMNTFPRFFSELKEIHDVWLIGATYVSGTIRPFPNTTSVTSSLGTLGSPFHQIHGEKLINCWGRMRINTITSSAPIVTTTENGVSDTHLSIDDHLQIVNNALSVKPRILYNNDYDLKYKDFIKIEWDSVESPQDTLSGTLFFHYNEDNSNLEDGKLKSVDIHLTGQGAIGVRKADWSLGGDDVKLRVSSLDVSEDFQQTNGVLAICNQGSGGVPFFQNGSGITSNGLITIDGAQTLSVPYVRLNMKLSAYK